MITIKDALKVRVTLVVKLNDFSTDRPVSREEVRVVSDDGFLNPVAKPGGYFVFTGRCPDAVRVVSRGYNDALVKTNEHTGTVLRLWLLSRGVPGATILLEGESHVGFGGNGLGYAVISALADASNEILPQKDDLADITDMYHALVTPQGDCEAVYIAASKPNGRYALREAPKHEYPAWGTRMIPLRRVMGGNIPIARGADTLYIMSGGSLAARKMEESK